MKLKLKDVVRSMPCRTGRTHRNEKGFTMVEMLIVIVLVGLIVTFLFSMLGNAFSGASVQQAATKVADDMRSVNDAAQKYAMEQTAQAASLANLTGTISQSGAPYLSAPPVPPAALGAGTAYAWDNATYTNTWGTATADSVIKVTIPTAQKAVCQQINQQFAGAAAGAAVPAAVAGGLGFQCFGAGPYTALMPVYIN